MLLLKFSILLFPFLEFLEIFETFLKRFETLSKSRMTQNGSSTKELLIFDYVDGLFHFQTQKSLSKSTTNKKVLKLVSCC